MEVRYLRLPKKTGTYADSLAVAGLERLLYLLGAGRSRIEDRGGFYELILKAPIHWKTWITRRFATHLDILT